MIVRSDKISSLDIKDAVNDTDGMYFLSYSKDYPRHIRFFRPRRFTYGYEFFCGGNSHHASAHDREHKAATWVAWGIFIDKLYRIDPEAQIGWYKNREDFMQKTRDNYRMRHGKVTLREATWLRVAPNETRLLLR